MNLLIKAAAHQTGKSNISSLKETSYTEKRKSALDNLNSEFNSLNRELQQIDSEFKEAILSIKNKKTYSNKTTKSFANALDNLDKTSKEISTILYYARDEFREFDGKD